MIFGIGFLPRLGIAGAALATGIGQIVTLSIYLVVYFSRPLPVHIRRCYLKPHGATDKKLYAIGVPAILNLALPSLLVSFLNALLAGFSQSYVVVLGIYYKLQTFLYLPANGIAFAGTTVIGQEVGGGEAERAKHDTKTFAALGLLAGLLGGVLLYTQALSLSGIFSPDEEVIQLAGTLLRIVAVAEPMFSLTIVLSGVLRGTG